MKINKLNEQIDHAIFKRINQLRAPFNLSVKERKEILKICKGILESQPINPKKYKNLIQKNEFVIPFVSIYENNQILACAHKPGNNFFDSLVQSSVKALETIQAKLLKRKINFYIKINLLINPVKINNATRETIKKSFYPGIHSISIKREKQFAYFKNSVPISHEFSHEKHLSMLLKKAAINPALLNCPDTTLTRYDTIEFREDYLNQKNPHGLYDLFRDNPLLLQKEITKKQITQSLILTLECFKKFFFNSHSKNIIYYEYQSKIHKWKNNQSPQAFLRKIASLWILIEMIHYTNELHLLEKIKPIVDNLLTKYLKINNSLAYIEHKGIIDLGTSGFMLSALIAMQEKNVYQKEIQGLFNFIHHSYNKKRNKLISIFQPPLSNHLITHDSEFYFPFIALNALYKKNDKASLKMTLNLSKKVFFYYKNLLRTTENKIKMVNWATQAYTNFYFETFNPNYAQFIFDMNDFILQNQILPPTEQIDLIGSFSTHGNSRATSAIVESLTNAYRVASHCQDKLRKEKYKDSIFMAMRFIIQSQIKPDNCFDENSLGGFKNDFFDSTIRIDTLQHCGTAIMNFMNIFF